MSESLGKTIVTAELFKRTALCVFGISTPWQCWQAWSRQRTKFKEFLWNWSIGIETFPFRDHAEIKEINRFNKFNAWRRWGPSQWDLPGEATGLRRGGEASFAKMFWEKPRNQEIPSSLPAGTGPWRLRKNKEISSVEWWRVDQFVDFSEVWLSSTWQARFWGILVSRSTQES